jgi:adenylate cyclase
LEGVAKPGAICLSKDAYRQVRARLDLEVSDLGQTRLKNIVEPMRVYSLQVGLPARTKPTASPSPTTADTSDRAAASEQPSIAVLPFQNMSDDPSQEFFVDGLVKDMITTLSKLPGLRVIARNSSFAYKGRSIDVREAARSSAFVTFSKAACAGPGIAFG